MAGRLLTAGCEEAPSLETADLVVINTCAIREGAEQKVIGRMGQLARLKAANPAMRVVLTGCSVREPDRGRPPTPLSSRRPLPAARRGAGARRSARAGVGAGADRRRRDGGRDDDRRADGRWRRGPPGRDAGPARSGRGRSPAARRSPPGCRSSTAATRPARTASSRSAADRSAAGRSTTSSTRREPSARPAIARSRCSARTSTRTATISPRRHASPTSTPSAGPAAGSILPGARTSPS